MTCRAQVSMERQIIHLDELEKTIKTQTYMQTQTHTYTYILNLQKHLNRYMPLTYLLNVMCL